MAENSKIQWTTHSWNPWRGCTRVSEGCRNCYAETLSGRNPGTLGVWGPNGTRVVAAESAWREPLKWDRQAKAAQDAWLLSQRGNMAANQDPPPERPRVFCASLADVFEEWQGPMTNSNGSTATTQIPGFAQRPMRMQDVRVRLFQLILVTPNLDWLLLTKRPQNILPMLKDAWSQIDSARDSNPSNARPFAIPPNVWLGTSVEDQEQADKRIPELLMVPAAVRFLSCEPLLGPVDLEPYFDADIHHPTTMATPDGSGVEYVRGIDWVIVGGESGPDARPCSVEWVRDIVQQCRAAGVACFVKQLGAVPVMDEQDWRSAPARKILKASNHKRTPAGLVPLAMADRKGGDMDEFPVDLRVREFPAR